MSITTKAYLAFSIYGFVLLSMSCKKLVEVDQPVDSITSLQNFNNEATAISSVIGIYNGLDQQTLSFGSGIITLYTGLSSDEFNYFDGTDITVSPFQNNSLTPDNSAIGANFWIPAYSTIYRANAVIEGLAASGKISTSTKSQLTGEAKFLRAFCHFYLVNLFGDVPLVTTTSWTATASMGRSEKAKIYQQIIDDLKDAQMLLPDDYTVTNGDRTRVNKSAATALLARAYLYASEWANAEAQATAVINNSALYSLETDLSNVFLKNSSEAIWQLETYDVSPFSTTEGRNLIPVNAVLNPRFSLTENLINAFDTADMRKSSWLGKNVYQGTTYYYPAKYKVRVGTSGNVTEYYMMLRLAEQYLIRAEAKAKQNNPTEAIDDLNVIRSRAKLMPLPQNLSQSEVLNAVENERRIELFAEWGHRWFDLKRTNRINDVMAFAKGNTWQTTAQLYPIPTSELQKSPSLSQNPGY
jgi:hypothetical protein